MTSKVDGGNDSSWLAWDSLAAISASPEFFLIRDAVKHLVAEIILGRVPIVISNRGTYDTSRTNRLKAPDST
jgi:hypothetical protein